MATSAGGIANDDEQLKQWKDDAKAGDELAQLSLGRHYLNLAQLGNDTQTNASLAVSFLIKSSKQGSEDATKILADCLDKELGIDDENKKEVVWCTATPQYDKVAREAIRKMFHEMKPQVSQDGLPRVPKLSFSQSVSQVASNKTELKLLMKAGKGAGDVSESEFVDKIIRRLEGHGSSLTTSVKNDADWDTFRLATLTEKLRHYPGKTAAWMLEATIETAGTQGALWLRSLIPINQIYTLVALLIYSAISLEAVLWLLPLLTFYISFAVLIVVTAQMLQARRRLGDVRTIASMLSRFATFDEHTAASMYMWNSMKPYATFFLTLPLCIASLTIVDSGWLLCPEFGVLSIATSFICFLALSNYYDIFALASVSIDFTSVMVPSVIESLPQIPIIYSVIWYLLGPGYAVELPVHGLCIRLGLPSLAFLIISLIFVKMAARKSWQGTYQVLVPHLVCFFWWRLSVAFFTRSTWFGLARALVGWIGVIFILPLVPFLVIGYGIYLFRSVTSFSSLLKVLTTVLLVIGASVYAWWSRKGFRVGSWFSLYGKSPLSRAGMILVIVIASCVPLAYVFQPQPRVAVDDSSVGTLSWESYHRYCLAPGSSVISCSKFTGAHVTASGVVNQWSVTLVENPAEAFAAWLPYPFSNWLRCAYGDSYPDNCSTIAELEDFEACTLNKQLGRPCHLRDLDRFTYRLTVDVPGSGSVTVVAANWFHDIADRIQPEAEITFGAVLTADKWGSGVELRLESIQCVDQSCEIGEEADSGRWRSLVLLGRAVHSVWNFFLAPLIVFTH